MSFEKEKKDKLSKTVSIVIPAYNEEENISSVISTIKKIDYVTEIIVVDDGSQDKTGEIAKSHGAILIKHIGNRGKGSALKTGLKNSKGDIVAFIDGDIKNLKKEMIDKITGPVLEGKIELVKTKFTRESGRVTELTAKPLLRFFFPELNLTQPLSGQFAGKRSVLEKLKFEKDYGVDIGIVLDADAKGIKIEEVDIGEIKHDLSPLNTLNEMANEVVRTIINRATEYGRVTMMDTLGSYIRMATLGLSLLILGFYMIFFVTWTPLIIGEIITITGIILTIIYLIRLIVKTVAMFKKRPKMNFIKSFLKMHLPLVISAFVLIIMITTFFSAATLNNGKLSIEPSSRNLVIIPSAPDQQIYLKGPYTVDSALENESNIIRMPKDALDTLGISYGDIITIGEESYGVNHTTDGEENILRLPLSVRQSLDLRIGDLIQDGRILNIFQDNSVKHYLNNSNLSTNQTAITNYDLNSRNINGVQIQIYLDNKYIGTVSGVFNNGSSYSIYFNGYKADTMLFKNQLIGNSYLSYYGNHIIEIKFIEKTYTSKTFKKDSENTFLSFNSN
ncbi:MAG: glycosyltransferase [Methanobrevibacter sp.]|jgi:glycosyltransferase involved in cell wall biosynthesis|nr:glycosyltransferase [Methanobrevibacter sp.]